MFDALLPPTVVTVATGADLKTELFAAELRALGRAVDARRREFTTGRACARRALAHLGLPAVPIGAGARGEPLWPAGIVGSITHCAGLRACAIALARDIHAVGIDAEPHAPLPDGVLAAIASPAERRALAEHEPAIHFDRVLFSAKEALFKACYPLTGRLLGFEDVDVRIGSRDGTFQAELLGEGAGPADLRGRWIVRRGLVATAVVVRT